MAQKTPVFTGRARLFKLQRPGTGALRRFRARACRDYGFKNAGLRRLISIIESENAASIRVAEKMEMTIEKSASFHGIPVLIHSVAHAVTGIV
jgi:hypothetical protein